VRETSAEEPMFSPNKDYHHKCCIPEQLTSVIQTNLMVVNEDSQFCGYTNSSIQVIIAGIKCKAPKPTNKCDYLLAQSK